MSKKGKAKPRTPEEQLHMRRRISAMMGRLQRVPLPWTNEQQWQWTRLYEVNLGISWCLGANYIIPPFVTQEEADRDG